MTTTDQRVVIFDFGGVLVDWNPRYLYRKLFGDDTAGMERFLAEVCSNEWNLQQDAGRPFAEAVTELAARYPGQADLIRAYHERWEETLAGPIDGSIAILRELKDAGHRLYGLTNWSHETFPFALARFAFFAWFDGIVVSGEERLVKPDPRLFIRLLERYGVDPRGTVFIDDNPPNVDAAIALGMHGIQFRSPEQLRAELVRLGLLA
jgi:2-haloacid dehalogenase